MASPPTLRRNWVLPRIPTGGFKSMEHVNDWASGVLRTLDKAIPSSPVVVGQNFTQPAAYPYTVLLTDKIVLVDTTAARAINLPLSVAGFQVSVKDFTGTAGANNITLTASAGELIDGAATYVMATNYQSTVLLGTGIVGNEWVVVQ